jgi:phosphotransferase system  glucose/maltose/N-acetylglucosamine-specific IIC component
MSYFLAIFLLLILAALAAAGFFLVRQRPDDEDNQPKVSNITKALTVRIGLSVFLFLCILISWKMGWIKPTGIPL